MDKSTGGMTLQDIILGVREILFEDGKDLVLLVEDFAALSGIQDVLFKVCIQEGEYEVARSVQRCAPLLRSPTATSRRAIRFLPAHSASVVIGNRQQTDDESKLASSTWSAPISTRLVGARRACKSVSTDEQQKRDLQVGSRVWRDRGPVRRRKPSALEAFGYSSSGNSLFPFNRRAIEQMTQRHLAEGGRLNFNPRRVINEILRSTLLMRSAFTSANFPPADFQGIRPNGYLAGWIRRTSSAGRHQETTCHAVSHLGRKCSRSNSACPHSAGRIHAPFRCPHRVISRTSNSSRNRGHRRDPSSAPPPNSQSAPELTPEFGVTASGPALSRMVEKARRLG